MALICSCHRLRLAGGARRLAGDRRRAGRGDPASTAAGSRPAGRCARWTSCRPPTRSSLDLAPSAVAELAGERLPRRVARAYRRYKHGPGAFKVDLAVEGGVPWEQEAGPPRRHRPRDRLLRGDRRRPSARSTAAGCPSAPSSSSASSTWPTRRARAATCTRSGPTRTSPAATTAMRPRRSSTRSNASPPACASASSPAPTRSPAEIEADNANFVGGDILTGANTPLQTLFRPRHRGRSLRDRHPRRLHLLGGDPARPGRARDVRLQRRPGDPARSLTPGALG